MTRRFNLIGFIAAVIWPTAIAVAQAPDCNDNSVPDDIDLAGKMYWADYSTKKIQRANLDGTNVEGLVTTGLLGPVGIALDPAAGKMYWTDAVIDKIRRADLDGSNVEDLVTTGLKVPIGIALDPAAGKMYWADKSTDKIQRANMDGTVVEDLVTGLGNPGGIALALPSPDTDADGVMDECDGCPTDATKTVPGICGCGVSDVDSDGDGTPDCFDQCPDDAAKTAPGICGCGVSDADGDGVPDCLDNCPNDPNKLDPGICGCGTPDGLDDGDDDGVIDCLDNCPTTANADQADLDSNGIGDACEPVPAGQPDGSCGCGAGSILMMPATLLGIGWTRRRTSRRQRGRRATGDLA